jgi:hypothetical protein
MKKPAIALMAALASLALAAPANAAVDAVTAPAASVTDSSAVLRGKVDAGPVSNDYRFEYGLTAAYGNHTPAVAFATAMPVKVALVGLSPGTAYHFRVVVRGLLRTVRGADQTFTTLDAPGLPDPGITNPLTNSSDGSGSGSGSSSGSGSGSDSGSGSGDGGGSSGGSTSTEPSPSGSGSDGSGGDQPAAVVDGGDTSALVLGSTVGAAPQSGEIQVQAPGADDFAPLPDGAAVPVGSTVDARHGSVNLVTAVGDAGAVQTATFSGAVFQVRQSPTAGGLTDIFLRGGDFSACRTTGRLRTGHALARRTVAHAARRRHAVRKLWGHDHHGRFRTHGLGAIATVRGTTWIVADHCDGTRTSVLHGAVSVRDKRRHRTVLVHAGHSYFARTSH